MNGVHYLAADSLASNCLTRRTTHVDVAVVLVNYNSAKHTISCVESILAMSRNDFDFKVIIIDNCSDLDEFEPVLALESNKVSVFRSVRNVGFASANMLGVQACSASYYFFLNNDCIFINDVIGCLRAFMERQPGVGICSGITCSTNGEPQKSWDYLPAIWEKLLGKGFHRLSHFPHYRNPKEPVIRPIRVEVLSGSQMFIRAEMFYRAGGFDTNFFLYCEEEDIAFSMRNIGAELWLVPDAAVIHYGGGSTIRSINIRKEFLISLVYLYRKHYGVSASLLIRLIYFLRYIKRAFTDIDSLSLAFFLLRGPHLCESFRHRQPFLQRHSL